MENKQFDKVRYDNNYIKNNYDRINFVMPKGLKEEIKEYAKRNKTSATDWIIQAIKEKMERQDNS